MVTMATPIVMINGDNDDDKDDDDNDDDGDDDNVYLPVNKLGLSHENIVQLQKVHGCSLTSLSK